MISKDRLYRNFKFEIREEAGKMSAVGKPVIFNREEVMYEVDGIQYKEKIDAGAFDSADMSDVVLNIDHVGKPAAKTRNGTLKLDVRSDGLYMDADLSKNATGRELYEDIRNGFYDRMSFAFTVEEDEYNRDTRTRTITKIKRLYDVSAVTFPAYEQTSIQARSFFEAEADREAREREAEDKAAEVAHRQRVAARISTLAK